MRQPPRPVPAALAPSEPDIGRIEEYGRQHPESWGGFSVDGGRLQARFTDPDAHREALLALVERPNNVDVIGCRPTVQQLAAIRAAVDALYEAGREPFYSWGESILTGRVHVSLAGTGLDLARQLHERFSDAVQLTVGGFDFPLDPDRPYRVGRFGGSRAIRRAGLDLTVTLDSNRAVRHWTASITGSGRRCRPVTTCWRCRCR